MAPRRAGPRQASTAPSGGSVTHAVRSVGAIYCAGPPQASVLTLAFRAVVTAGPALAGAMPGAGVFRPDINALRAWAVVVVVLYHFNIAGFTSGFVGVDIFFVISGYLITGQALAQLEAGNFSFRVFWTARLLRIFPALIVMVLATLFFGAWLTMPNTFLRHIRQMLFAVTFLSNITFGDARGYFDTAAQTKPLLHTWSLAIEWQFYLLMPLVLAAVWRALPAAHKKFSLLALLVLSMLLSMVWFFHLAQKGAGRRVFLAWRACLGAAGRRCGRRPAQAGRSHATVGCSYPAWPHGAGGAGLGDAAWQCGIRPVGCALAWSLDRASGTRWRAGGLGWPV